MPEHTDIHQTNLEIYKDFLTHPNQPVTENNPNEEPNEKLEEDVVKEEEFVVKDAETSRLGLLSIPVWMLYMFTWIQNLND